jgi:hypothetical protein
MSEPRPTRCPWCDMVADAAPHATLDDCVHALEMQIEYVKALKQMRDTAQKRFYDHKPS